MKKFIKSKLFDSIVLKILLLIVGLGPIIYFHYFKNVSIKVIIFGAFSWNVGVIIKMILHQIIIKPLSKKKTTTIIASSLNGFISGISELSGAILVILLMMKGILFTFDTIVSFGFGIGAIEVLVVAFISGSKLLKGTALEESSKKTDEVYNNLTGINHYLYNIGFTVAERITATLIHVSTRGLVFIALLTHNIIPLLIALSVFIIADGYLGYYFYVTDKFLKLKGANQFILLFSTLAIISSAIFIILIQQFKLVTP